MPLLSRMAAISNENRRREIETVKNKIASGQMEEGDLQAYIDENPWAATELKNTAIHPSVMERGRQEDVRSNLYRTYLKDTDGKPNKYLTDLQKQGVSKARIDYLRDNPYATPGELNAALQEASGVNRQEQLQGRGLRGKGGLKGQKIPSSALQKQIIDVILADPDLGQLDDNQARGMASNVNLRARALMDQDPEQKMTAEEAVDQALGEERQYFTEKDPGTRFVPFTGSPAGYSRPRGRVGSTNQPAQDQTGADTPEAVREAFRTGKIDRATARKLLEGMQ